MFGKDSRARRVRPECTFKTHPFLKVPHVTIASVEWKTPLPHPPSSTQPNSPALPSSPALPLPARIPTHTRHPLPAFAPTSPLKLFGFGKLEPKSPTHRVIAHISLRHPHPSPSTHTPHPRAHTHLHRTASPTPHTKWWLMGELKASVHVKATFVVQALSALGEFGQHFQAFQCFGIELKRTNMVRGCPSSLGRILSTNT